ncbi:MAG: diguanylate cyclase [Lachnospiraceae bacterium]|nr:diguanylate cyclase [Lachnospiraceae bacterium]
MYYSSFGILAVLHHIILNYDVLKNGRKGVPSSARYRYRQFLQALLVFYITDLLWGFLIDLRIRPLAYANTLMFFAFMGLSVLLWTRYIAAFLDKKGIRATSFLAAGWGIYTFVILGLIVNFFYPVIFTMSEDTVYEARFGRFIVFILQFLLFLLISIYSLVISQRSEGRDKIHYLAVGVAGGVMAVFVVLQMIDPFAPFYTVGCILSNCVVHIFVEEDEKREQDRITADARKEREIYTQVSLSLAKDYEAIYYVDLETGKYREISASRSYRTLEVPEDGEDFYKETRENARRYAHPDDRAFAESMYNKETMRKNLEGRRSYSYNYRIMFGDIARYYRFDVMLSNDGEHFVLCDKDVQDTITAETALLEKQKANITFSQIAESLASNYDVIYYVDAETGDYVGYTSNNIYGELKIDESGNDFFTDAKKNSTVLVHPKDRERLFTVLDRDYLLTALEGRKQFSCQYCLIVNGQTQNTRFTARKSSDGRHMIIGVENIEDEIRKENEHLRALNTEKELARRDELTGVRNKTAFNELEQSLQENIERGMDYLPFAFAVCDLNDLKMTNDSRGHSAGDEYITSSTKVLCELFKHSPVFRIGGDEFVIFLRGEDYTAREELVERLRQTSRENRDRKEGPVIAVGLAEYEPSGDINVSNVFDRADQRMYEDKRELKSAASS